MARLAHERYTEGLLAISELAAATTAARAEAKIAAVDDQFEEYLQNRQHQQGQEQEQEQEQSSHHQQLDSMEVDENIHKNGDNDNDNNDDEDIL